MGEAGEVTGADEGSRPTYAARMAALSVGGATLELTEPRPLKLMVDDLVLLDHHWHDDDHHSTELIDGRIYFTPARYRPRCSVAGDLFMALRESAAVVAPHLSVGTRGSIEISPYDLPLPDIVLTSEINGEGFIPVASVPLVVEVAETALDFYLGEKLRAYARAAIPEYWVVDISGRSVHQMSLPDDNSYVARIKTPFGLPISSATIAALIVQTSCL